MNLHALEHYCGKSIDLPTSSFIPKSEAWFSNDLLGHLIRADFNLNNSELRELKDLLWNDLCSEFDAENFCQFLDANNFTLSNEFKLFEFVWRRDEWNHFQGFKKIYSVLYSIPDSEIIANLKSRKIDFNPIRKFLEDEFYITIVLAYDEIATTMAYAQDKSLYQSFSNPNLYQWIKKVTRDESYHFHNCMSVIGRNHFSKISLIPEFIDKLISWDLNGSEYSGTFVLDHDGPYFTPAFLNRCGDIIKNYYK